jgi:hypothetical protein
MSRRAPGTPRTWPEPSGKTRVLVEHPDAAVSAAYELILEDAGYEVATCAGPAAHGEGVDCPLLSGGECSLVEGADVVVSTSSLPYSGDILAALSASEGAGVVFEAPQPFLESHAVELEDVTALPTPATDATLRIAVAAARPEPAA